MRFFVPYRDETIDFITRMLPKVDLDEMVVIVRYYANNKRETGERYNRTKFLDSLAKRTY